MKNKTWFVFWISFLTAITSGSAEVSDILSLSNLAIPPSLGKIDSRFVGKSERWVIHIQDIHAHLGAQENIAALVEHLHTYYGIKIAAIEGGWSATSYPKSWALPPTRGKQMLARTLLEEAYISGPIHSALFSETPLTVAGIEDKKLYGQNRQIYIQHIEQREGDLEKIKLLDEKINREKSGTFNPDLLAFDKALSEFREGRQADRFIPSLLAQAESRGVDTSDLNQISIFKSMLALEKTIDKQKLQSEAGRLMEEFKRKGLHFEELLKNGEVPEEKLEFYPNAQKYLQLMHTQDEINHRQFFLEIETAVSRMKEKLLSTEDEKTLDARASAVLFSKKVILFQATPDDLRAFEKSGSDSAEEIRQAGLDDALQLGQQFYKLAKQRDDIFYTRIANHPKLQGNIMLVAGGFHTEGLSARLEDAGISYVVITPDLANQPADEALYFKRLTETPLSTQALSQPLEWALKMDTAFSAMAERYRVGIQNLGEAVNAVLSFKRNPRAEPGSVISTTPENFESLSPEDQKQAVLAAAQEIGKNNKPVWLFIKAKDLKSIFVSGGETSAALWQTVIGNPANKVVLLYEELSEILDIEGIEGRRNVIPVKGTDLEKALHEKPLARESGDTAIIANPEEYKGNAAKILLPPRSASLLLFRALVESGWRYNYADPQTQSRIEMILNDLQISGLLAAAA